MSTYQLAVILTVEADSYNDAVDLGELAVEQCREVLMANPDGKGLTMRVETDYERDGSKFNQRVLYLHDENVALTDGTA